MELNNYKNMFIEARRDFEAQLLAMKQIEIIMLIKLLIKFQMNVFGLIYIYLLMGKEFLKLGRLKGMELDGIFKQVILEDSLNPK